jgi:hypothetical protein
VRFHEYKINIYADDISYIGYGNRFHKNVRIIIFFDFTRFGTISVRIQLEKKELIDVFFL